MRLVGAGRSHNGYVRTNNEDCWYLDDRVAVVADGVRGRPAGEVASRVASDTFVTLTRGGVPAASAASVASTVVHEVGIGHSLLHGMCCTLTAVVVVGDALQVAHVGDSKAWLVIDGTARRISRDDTVVSRMVAEGLITGAEAAAHPRRNQITQALGLARPIDPHSDVVPVHAGARIVLATDGLDYADDENVAKLMTRSSPASVIADALVDAALAAGGHDNVTVVVADVVELR